MTTPEYPSNQPPYQPPYQPPAAPQYQPPAAPQYQPPAPQYQPPAPQYQPPAPQYQPPAPAAPQPYGDPQQLAPIPPGSVPPGGYPGAPVPPPAPTKKGAGKIFAILAVVLVVVIGGCVGLAWGGRALLKKAEDVLAGPATPWEGTPIADYKPAAQAIELPTAKAVPGFTAAEVQAALENVKKAMIAGRVDEKMLYEHDVTTLRALFSEYGQDLLDDAFDNNFGTIVATRIASGHKLVEDGIRARGTVTFKASEIDGVTALTVHTEFVWVYAFTGTLITPGDHLVYIEDKIDWIFPAPDEVRDEYVGMELGEDSEFSVIGMDCDLADKDLIALGKLTSGGNPTQGANNDLPPASDC